MDEDGVATFLLLVDPVSLVVQWANDRVEESMRERGEPSPVGRLFEDVVPLSREVGAVERLKRTAETGVTESLFSRTFSVTGDGSRTYASFYRLPSGQVLAASEWIKDSETRHVIPREYSERAGAT